MSKKVTSVEWIESEFKKYYTFSDEEIEMLIRIFNKAKAMERDQMLDFGEFIIDELEPMAQNRDWVEERYNYFTEGE